MAITTSAQSLIVSVFRMLGITAQGEDPTAAELLDGKARLDELVDAWGLDRLVQPVVRRAQYTTVAGQASYTIGPAGTVPTPDWIGPRPEFVGYVALLLTNSTPNTELPLGELTDMSYTTISQKTLSNSQPTAWKYTPTSPAGTFTLWPVPDNSTYPIVVYASEAVLPFTSLTASYSLPSGYMRALRYNLAREIAHEYGRDLPQRIEQLALESLGAVRAHNVPVLDLALDGALTPHSGRHGYDIVTDTP